jgi:hypothetical protein
MSALLQQEDLVMVPGGGGYEVFENTDFLPERAARSQGPVTAAGSSSAAPLAADVAGWHPVLPGAPGSPSFHGRVPAGTVFSSYAPSGSWHLQVAGGSGSVTPTPAFGWASQYAVSKEGQATLSFDGSPLVTLAILLELVLWVAVLALLVGRRPRLRRRPAGGELEPAEPPTPGPFEPTDRPPDSSETSPDGSDGSSGDTAPSGAPGAASGEAPPVVTTARGST